MSQSSTVYQVSDLTNEMRRLMETSYPEIWIEGELSSLSTPASGHLYFSLKDERSQLRCAMFKGRASLSRYKAKAGDLVRVRAKISVYTARGDLQCIVQHIEEAGEGLLQRRFEELKNALNQEGLFDQGHKQAIPKFPKRIGLITSPTGAAVKDVVSTLARRCPGIPVTIYPAVVQGDTAAKSLEAALASAVQHQQCDVIILSRGGGSLEDLWCFNDERLARAIRSCPIPIISGVGHEVDITIADLVADLRAPTPTAAAELVSPDTSQLVSQLQSLHFRLPRAMERKLQQSSQSVDMLNRRLIHPRQQLERKQEGITQANRRLMSSMLEQLRSNRTRLNHQHQRLKTPAKSIADQTNRTQALANRLKQSLGNRLQTKQQGFRSLGEQLNLVSPLATLDRGFSIARDQQGAILRQAAEVDLGQDIRVQLSTGELECKIVEIKG